MDDLSYGELWVIKEGLEMRQYGFRHCEDQWSHENTTALRKVEQAMHGRYAGTFGEGS